MRKTVVVLILTIQLLVGFCINTYAFSDLTKEQEEKISDIISIGIMKGDEFGRFRPNDCLTKAEATTIVLRLRGYSTSYIASPSTFKDVSKSHWASQIIGLASNLKLVKGDENNNYFPDKKLNYAELLTMCLRVVGVGELLDSTERWPYAHMEFCSNEHIINKLSKSVYEPVTRVEAATIISKFLTANIWEKDISTGIYEKKDDVVMSKYLDISYYKDALVMAVDKKYREISILTKDDDGNYTKMIDCIKLASDLKCEDYSLGSVISVYVKANQALKVDIIDESKERVVNFDDITEFNSSSNSIKLDESGKNKKYNFSDDFVIVKANGETAISTKDDLGKAKRLIQRTIVSDSDDEEIPVTGKAILDVDNNIISISLAKYKKLIVVKSISNDKITGQSISVHTKSGIRTTTFDLKNKDYDMRDVYGVSKTLDDLTKGDMLIYSNSGEPYTVLLLDDTITGKVTSLEADEYVVIDGVEYYRNKQFCSSLPDRGDVVTLYLDQSNKIVAWE